LSPQFKPFSNKKLQELIKRMNVEESSVESLEIEVIQNFWRLESFDFNTNLVITAFNNIVF
jgi:hypothetical protein